MNIAVFFGKNLLCYMLFETNSSNSLLNCPSGDRSFPIQRHSVASCQCIKKTLFQNTVIKRKMKQKN